LPVTDDVIRWHLCGLDDSGREFVMGVYPMLRDESCFFLVVDLDKAAWQEDAQAVLETCQRMNLPAAVERSRSGKGGHIWLFFEEAVPAALARKVGAHILTETMERRPDVGLDSYDRLFPNQDTLPHGGFGNLIALPLQKRPRDEGNSLFLNDGMLPHADQWAFLSSSPRIGRSIIEAIAEEPERRGRVVGVRLAVTDDDDAAPWTRPPSGRRKEPPLNDSLPERIELVFGNQLFLAKKDLPPGLRNRVIRLAAFQNPEFYKAQAMRLPTYDKPRIIACAEDHGQYVAIPRGCLEDLQQLLADLHIEAAIRDERYPGRPLDVEFRGVLYAEQEMAARAMLAHDMGVLSATTAFGKTVIAAWLIAQRKVNTLVLVHRQQLLEQWLDRLCAFLNLPSRSIGRIGGGRTRPTGVVDVAIIQSLVRKHVVSDRVAEYGHLIIDECHHVPARSFEQLVRQSKTKFVTGLSATVARKDGHHPIVFMQCGPVRYRVDARSPAAARPFAHTVFVRPTGFFPWKPLSEDARVRFQELYSQLVVDQARNELICQDVLESVHEGRSPLVLTERNEHLGALAGRLSSSVENVVVMRGGMKRAAARSVVDRLSTISDTEQRVLLATGRYIGEGFDDARLDTLFLTLPVSWRGTVAQYVGRLHRVHHRKQEVRVYDYADLNTPMLARMFDRRCRGYEAVGYRILLPGSAVPGWPTDVPLPVDPQWKREYAAAVQRLVRDGIDAPLALLFKQVAKETEPGADGAARARSASEAFLYQRLETLPATQGRFVLNTELPIPFDGHGRMEVDLLCTDARLAVELDGLQHLDSTDAYRRDRQKDLLLQEHGYFVLRFLAHDVGSRLDSVLNAILRALSRRMDKGSR
jgi:superfamily II DNA or RNA helicase/very-short-patch-repair endonuclease